MDSSFKWIKSFNTQRNNFFSYSNLDFFEWNMADGLFFKPKDSAMNMATVMGIEILSEEQYRELQKLGNFDTKTSSWIKTPTAIRKLGGALFADYRYGTVFVYHNGAESYYAARGFRSSLRV